MTNNSIGDCIPATVELFFALNEIWEEGEIGGTCNCCPAAKIVWKLIIKYHKGPQYVIRSDGFGSWR